MSQCASSVVSSVRARRASSSASDEEITSLDDVPERSWPLFLRAHHWLRLLDGTLAEGSRFFSEDERAAVMALSATTMRLTDTQKFQLAEEFQGLNVDDL